MALEHDAIVLGLDVGGTKCAVLAGTSDGRVLARDEWASEAERGPEFMLERLLTAAGDLRQRFPGMCAVGVSIGGPLDAAEGVVLSPPNLPGWDRIPLKARLERAFGLPVGVEHDAAACALAEYVWGLNRDCRRLIYLTCATGFGAGMVFDGRPYYGVHGRSPEIGHVKLADDGPEAFGIRGSAEAFCSARSLGRIAAWQHPERWPREPEPREIADLWREGDADAEAVVDLNARMTGRCCAMLADLLHPDRIALGSLARYLGAPWIGRVRAEFERLALAEAAEHCALTGTVLGERLQDLSALAAALGAID